MSASKIISFADTKPERDESMPAPEKLISGTPLQLTENYYEDEKGRFFTGFWSSAPGKWHVNYDGEEEFCQLISGEVEITSDQGEVARFSAGDRFVIPAGFNGTWETIEACKKLYVISLVG
ncbi:MAG: cupin domain-containing protein [Alphaproteobacteria bacterium]|nr:cupin domain-containing protein [Alphaproteobacteria bacterium]